MRSFSPSWRVIFRDLASGDVKFDASDTVRDVVSIQTSKNYGRGAGTWKIVLTGRIVAGGMRYDGWLIPDDIVEIWLCAGGAGDKMVCVMAGLIDRVAKTEVTAEGGAVVKQIVVTGTDFGKLLMSEIGWDISAAQMQIGKEFYTNWVKRMVLLAGTPAELAQATFDIAKNDVEPIERYIDTQWLESTDDWHTLNESGYLLEQTPIWVAMKRVANEPWNMLYADFDDRGGKLHVGLEKIPLDENGYVLRDKSKTLTVTDDLVIQTDLGVCDAERVNLVSLQTPVNEFMAGGSSLDINLTHKESTKIDENSIRKHGFRPHIIDTQFFPPTVKATACYDNSTNFINSLTSGANIYDAIADRVNHMWNWFSKNHLYMAGMYALHGSPHARAGWKLVDTATGMSYLIENVAHHLTVQPAPQFVTHLQVTHGVRTSRTR